MQGCLRNQDTFSEKSEALDSHPIWRYEDCLSNQDILSKKSEALDLQTMLEYVKEGCLSN